MAEIPPIAVKVQLQLDQLKSQIAELKSQISSAGNAVHESGSKFAKFGETAKEAFGSLGLIAGVAEAINFLKESTQVAGTNAQQQVELARQLKIVTGATAEQSKAVNEHIEKLSEMSGVVASDIRPSFEVFARSTHDTTKALALQKVALDVAAGTGKNVHAVSMAMTRALTGNVGALNRMVPGIKNAKDPLAELQKQFHGAAAAAANTNPMGKFNVAMEKIKIVLGQALLPVIRILIPILNAIMPIFDAIANVLQAVLKPVMALVNGLIKALMPAISGLLKIITTVIDQAMKPLTAAFKPLITVVSAIAKFFGMMWSAMAPIYGEIVKALMPVLISLSTVFIKLAAKVLPPLLEVLEKVFIPILNLVVAVLDKYLLPAFNTLADALNGYVGQAINFIGDAFNKLGGMLQPVWDNVLKPMIDGLMAMMGLKVEPSVKVKVDKSELTGNGSIAGLIQDPKKAVGAATGGAQKTNPLIGFLQTTQDKILSLQKTYHEKVAAANAKYVADIQKQVNDFKNAFAQATATDLGQMFADGAKSADSMIAALKSKLSTVQNFATDAGKLASAGFSKDFIQQVIAQGPVAGDQMAQAILQATPEAQKQMQDLFKQTQDVSKHGVDDVAKQMADQFQTSTKALTTALDKAAKALRDSLSTLDVHVARKVKSMHGNVGNAATTLAQTETKLMTAEKGAGVTVNVVNHNQTNASPTMIAQATVNSIKFGLPFTGTVGHI